jgi:hypothetical protein
MIDGVRMSVLGDTSTEKSGGPVTRKGGKGAGLKDSKKKNSRLITLGFDRFDNRKGGV